MVAAIDHRLPLGTPLATQIEDLKSAVRFLRVHACGLVGLRISRTGIRLSSGTPGPEVFHSQP